MQIVQPYAKMLYVRNREDGIAILRGVEWIGRISHRSEEAQTGDSWERFIKAVVLEHGDWSITEHYSVIVDALVDRGITHEWVRHRLGAYTQESTRFCNYGKKGGEIKVIQPNFLLNASFEQDRIHWNVSVRQAEVGYLEMLKDGVSPQIARSVLPNSLASRLIVTYNLRMWRHFFIMRTAKEAHPQMRQVIIPLLKEFQEKIPLLYDDIVPEERQIDAMRKAR